MSKKALGKGIEALLKGGYGQELAVKEINIGFIKPNPLQPRKTFSQQSLDELAKSIKQKGIIQPIIVEKNSESNYTIIAGERRLRAAKLANLNTIPAIIKSFSKTEKLEIALIENLHRDDLTPIEEAAAYKELLEISNITQDELAKRVGKDRSTIANSLRLLKLSPEMKNAINNKTLTAGHARAILSLNNPSHQQLLFSRIIKDNMSVREAELLSSKLNKGFTSTSADKKTKPIKLPELLEIEQKLIEKLGTKVCIKGSTRKGKLEISYYSSDDLERLLDIIIG